MTTPEEEALEPLLDYLREQRGCDLGDYRITHLVRSTRRRMQHVGAPTCGAYVDYLRGHPVEFHRLRDAVLTKTTRFYRDPETWAPLARLIAELFRASAADQPFRAWSAGCASGEEAYSLAILLAAVVGRKDCARRVQLVATDVDGRALVEAKRGVYDARALEHLPPKWRSEYFERLGEQFAIAADLRRFVSFSQHDLLTNAPIPRVDVVLCRNTLIYFTRESQARFLRRVHLAMNEAALLVVGSSEVVLADGGDLFASVEPGLPIFARRAPSAARETADHRRTSLEGLYRASLDATPVARIILDDAGRVAFVNRRGRELLSLTHFDVGRRFEELAFVACSPKFRARVRDALIRGVGARLALRLEGSAAPLTASLVPLNDVRGEPIGIELRFAAFMSS